MKNGGSSQSDVSAVSRTNRFIHLYTYTHEESQPGIVSASHRPKRAGKKLITFLPRPPPVWIAPVSFYSRQSNALPWILPFGSADRVRVDRFIVENEWKLLWKMIAAHNQTYDTELNKILREYIIANILVNKKKSLWLKESLRITDI